MARPALFDIGYSEAMLDEYKEKLEEVLPHKRAEVGRLINLIREL